MSLYLVQQGQATSEEEDPERPLTERGVVDVQRVARKAAESGIITAVRVAHSGKTRAAKPPRPEARLSACPSIKAKTCRPERTRRSGRRVLPPKPRTSCWSATYPIWPSRPTSCSLATGSGPSSPSSRAGWSASSR
jgi:hypothetical protein